MSRKWPFEPLEEDLKIMENRNYHYMDNNEIDEEIKERLERRDKRIKEVNQAQTGSGIALFLAAVLMFVLFFLLFRLSF